MAQKVRHSNIDYSYCPEARQVLQSRSKTIALTGEIWIVISAVLCLYGFTQVGRYTEKGLLLIFAGIVSFFLLVLFKHLFDKRTDHLVEEAVLRKGLVSDFVFSGPVSDADKWRKYASADLFVLPTHSENFGIVIAEALYAGLPVITTKGAPWEDIVKTKSGWWVDDAPGALASALADATSKREEELHDMGVRGHKLILDKYSWNGIVKELIEKYKELLSCRGG